MSADLISVLSKDLKNDAEKLAAGEAVSVEIERRTLGRIGVLVVEISKALWTKEELKDVAAEVANRVVSGHVESCASGGGVRRAAFGRLFDKYFVHLWWGLVLLCLVFGVREVADAIISAWRVAG